jgi:hypothetical protein
MLKFLHCATIHHISKCDSPYMICAWTTRSSTMIISPEAVSSLD